MINKFITLLQNADLNEYRSIPFWSWNDELNEEELLRQIGWMCENNIGGFFMHARSGLKTEYLSDEWFECIKTCSEEAEKLGMDAWVYDENGWPSGFAGGKLLENEEDRDCYIRYTIGDYDGTATVNYLILEEELVRKKATENGEFLNLFIETAVSTTDILNPNLVAKFLRVTHEEYKRRFGEDFNKKFKGFFTDEPQYQRWKTPYSRMLPAFFKEKYNIDILDQLGLLILKKQGYKQFRYRYWKAMQELMLNNFAKQIYEWCDSNNVALTGHYAQEDSVGLQMTTSAGIMPFYEYEHIPGIDWLGRATDSEITVKQVTSASEQLGKRHILTETFGCCGWDISPAEMGRILGYQFANGVNMFCQHLIPVAEHGSRKRDFPAHFSPLNPWVDEGFKDFNIAFTRLGHLIGESKKSTNVAVLHPMRSAYFDYFRELEDQYFGIEEIEKGFADTCNTLSGYNIAHHYLDETLLCKYGFVNGNKLGCAKIEYDFLIIPPIYTMDKATESLLRKYAENGGKILLMGRKPDYLEAEPFDFYYLNSNCTFEEIVKAQPYRVENSETKVISTYNIYNEIPFIFAQNASSQNSYTQTFILDEKYKSFNKVDLVTLETSNIPLTVEFKKNEFALLIPSEKEYNKEKNLTDYVLCYKDAPITFKENFLNLDTVRYSSDGINYSEPRYTQELYNTLVKEKYNGELYLKYEFEVNEKPTEIYLAAEEFSISNAKLNGKDIKFCKGNGWHKHFYKACISNTIKIGINEYVIKLNWVQDDNVYMALFGENVTESLKNCLLCENEIEPIYITGKFGVYSHNSFMPSNHEDFISATDFYIGKIPQRISEMVTDGLPFFTGKATLSQSINFENTNVNIILDGNFQMATVRINGNVVKSLLFEKEVDVSEYLVKGDNLIETDFIIGLRNLLGPHHYTGYKYDDLSPFKFELTGTWENGKSQFYHSEYDFLKFYK